jgi:hypothetical protein
LSASAFFNSVSGYPLVSCITYPEVYDTAVREAIAPALGENAGPRRLRRPPVASTGLGLPGGGPPGARPEVASLRLPGAVAVDQPCSIRQPSPRPQLDDVARPLDDGEDVPGDGGHGPSGLRMTIEIVAEDSGLITINGRPLVDDEDGDLVEPFSAAREAFAACLELFQERVRERNA